MRNLRSSVRLGPDVADAMVLKCETLKVSNRLLGSLPPAGSTILNTIYVTYPLKEMRNLCSSVRLGADVADAMVLKCET